MVGIRIINRLLLVTGLFTLVSFTLAQNNFANERGLRIDAPTPEISSDEKKEVNGKATESAPEGEMTAAEIKVMMGKLASAAGLLDSFWREHFAAQNFNYTTPKTVPYTGSVSTYCGEIGRGNAAYCARSHTIYFDVNFFARMMKLTATNLNSDGDMAVIAVLAHEWGHAVQFQTRALSKFSIMNELQADCLSGAFARYATEKGVLEEGDTKEAVFAFAIAGDNSPWFAPQAHGSSKMRVGSFSLGFQKGIAGCRQ